MITVTTEQAAAMLDVSPATIRSWVMRGRLEPIRRGAKPLRFMVEDVTEAGYRALGDLGQRRLDALSERLLATS